MALMLKSFLIHSITKGGGQWVVYPLLIPCRARLGSRTDKGTKITIPHEGFHEVVPEVLSLLRNAPGAVVKTPYRIPLHMCWPKVQVPVRVHLFMVYSSVQFTILLPCYICIKEEERPILLHLHGKFAV